MKQIAVLLDKTKESRGFIEETDARLKLNDIKRNPFIGFCKAIEVEGEFIALIQMKSVLPIEPPEFLYKEIFKKGIRARGYKGRVEFIKDKARIKRLFSDVAE